MITVEHLTKCYGDFLAVDDLSFEIEEGHVYGFLGPNGAGKSTTMNIITGCLSATSGRVRIDGHDIFEEPGAAKRLIGYLPEQPPLYLNETPVEYLRFVGEAKGLRGGALERQIAEVVEQTRLTGVRHRCISALSKGYRQRVGIAQALLGSPRVIILDEPTVGLDPLQIIEIRELIRQLGQTHTVLFSSHILSEVQTICDQILMIAHGKLAAFGAPDELESRLLTPNEITLTAEGTEEQVRALLDGIGAITGRSITAEEGGLVTARLKTGREASLHDVSRALFFAFAGGGGSPAGDGAEEGQSGGYLHRADGTERGGPGRRGGRGGAGMTAVFKHELRSYFHSLTAYVFGAFLLAFIGIGAMLYNLQAAVSNFEYVLSFASLVFVVIVPVLTMRVLAEERRQKTDQLLYSLPITTVQIIAGKYLALLVLYLIPLAIIAVYPLIFAQFGDVYLLTSYGSILAFFLLGAALIAVGVFLSSLTDNQGLAAGLGIAVILLNYYSVSLSEYVSSTPVGALAALLVLILAVGAVVRYLTRNSNLAYGVCLVLLAAVAALYFVDSTAFEGLLPSVMSALSLFERFYTFVNGVFDLTAVFYYLTVAALFLFLSVQSLEKRRYN